MPDQTPSTSQRPAPDLAISTLSFGPALDRGRMALEEIPDAVYPLGFRAVELNDRHLRTRPALKQRGLDWLMASYFGDGAFFREYTSSRLLALHQAFSVSSVQVAAWTILTDFTLAGKAARWQMNYLEGAIAAANDFGARIVCIQSGGPPDPSEQMLIRCAEGLQQAAQLARHFHTRLALQYGSGLACTAARTLQLLQAVNTTSLGVCLDLGRCDTPASRTRGFHHPQAGELAMLAPYAIHAHARACPAGALDTETTAALQEGLTALEAARYNGWIAVVNEGAGDPEPGVQAIAELIHTLTSA